MSPHPDSAPNEKTVQRRVAILKESLDDPFGEPSRSNILALLDAYARNEIKEGEIVYAQAGKLYDKRPEPMDGSPIWIEVRFTIHSYFSMSNLKVG